MYRKQVSLLLQRLYANENFNPFVLKIRRLNTTFPKMKGKTIIKFYNKTYICIACCIHLGDQSFFDEFFLFACKTNLKREHF
jgi:hypothetical protein